MKTTDIIFWAVLAAIAIFYITVGNDMYKERVLLVKEKFSQESNSSK